LQAFNLDAHDIPISVLQSELPKRIENIHGIHPKKMQELVKAILSGVYHCDVRQLGYTHDGGIDLILLESDSPIAVQVKRREHPSHTEGVSGIREFLGASLIREFKDLIYVTTAHKFSKSAHNEVNKRLVQSFTLLSRDYLQSILVDQAIDVNWKSALESAQNNDYTMPKIPDPYSINI